MLAVPGGWSQPAWEQGMAEGSLGKEPGSTWSAVASVLLQNSRTLYDFLVLPNQSQIPTPALDSVHPPAFPSISVCPSPWAPTSAASTQCSSFPQCLCPCCGSHLKSFLPHFLLVLKGGPHAFPLQAAFSDYRTHTNNLHGPYHLDHIISLSALTHIAFENCISQNRHKTPLTMPIAPSPGLGTQGHTTNPCCLEMKWISSSDPTERSPSSSRGPGWHRGAHRRSPPPVSTWKPAHSGAPQWPSLALRSRLASPGRALS